MCLYLCVGRVLSRRQLSLSVLPTAAHIKNLVCVNCRPDPLIIGSFAVFDNINLVGATPPELPMPRSYNAFGHPNRINIINLPNYSIMINIQIETWDPINKFCVDERCETLTIDNIAEKSPLSMFDGVDYDFLSTVSRQFGFETTYIPTWRLVRHPILNNH